MDYFKLMYTGDTTGLDLYLNTHDVNEEINKQSLLYWAVFYNNFPITQRLIQHGVDVNKIDKHGRTALHIACYFGFYDISKTLLLHGAIIDITCFERASNGWDGHYQSEIIELLKGYID